MCDTSAVLILVRHGRTSANAQGLLQGRLDLDLDEVGRRQAARVASAIRARGPVDLVVSSPLNRALQTADAFGGADVVDDRWLELAYGIYEGQPFTSVPDEVWRAWRADLAFAPEGAESLGAIDARVRDALADLVERASTGTVVVVSHVSPIKASVAWALGATSSIAWNCHLDHAAVCRIEFRRGEPVLHTFNESLAEEAPG